MFSPGRVFAYCNMAVLPAWLLLLLLPGWKGTRILAAYVVPALLAGVYILLLLARFGPAGGGFGSLDELSRMFQNPWLLVAGWLHYLTLDLFVGAWEVRDAQRLGIRHAFVVPCLALTFLVGPAGLLVYLIVRAVVVRRWPGVEAVPTQRD